MTVMRETLLPLTIGEDQPRPGMSVVHSTFSDFDHFSGRLELAAAGVEEGPRKEGHSGSAAKAIEIAKMVVRARIMVLGTPQSNADAGPQAGRPPFIAHS